MDYYESKAEAEKEFEDVKEDLRKVIEKMKQMNRFLDDRFRILDVLSDNTKKLEEHSKSIKEIEEADSELSCDKIKVYYDRFKVKYSEYSKLVKLLIDWQEEGGSPRKDLKLPVKKEEPRKQEGKTFPQNAFLTSSDGEGNNHPSKTIAKSNEEVPTTDKERGDEPEKVRKLRKTNDNQTFSRSKKADGAKIPLGKSEGNNLLRLSFVSTPLNTEDNDYKVKNTPGKSGGTNDNIKTVSKNSLVKSEGNNLLRLSFVPTQLNTEDNNDKVKKTPGKSGGTNDNIQTVLKNSLGKSEGNSHVRFSFVPTQLNTEDNDNKVKKYRR